MTVCLCYSSGIPILLWIAAGGFTYKYWVDKWCLLRAYEKPKLIDDDMFGKFGGTTGILFLGLTVKVALGSWLYASAGGRNPRQTYSGDIERPFVIPYMLTGGVVLVYYLLTQCRSKKSKPSADSAEEQSLEVGAGEDLMPFSDAYSGQHLVNSDYDYEMDEVELEEKMEQAFGVALVVSASAETRMPDTLFQTVLDSVWDGGESAGKSEVISALHAGGRGGVQVEPAAPHTTITKLFP